MLSLLSSAKWSRIFGKKGKHERRETGKKDKKIFAENARFMPQLHYDYGGWKKRETRYICGSHCHYCMSSKSSEVYLQHINMSHLTPKI